MPEQPRSIPQMEPWYGDEERSAMGEYLNSGGWLMEFEKTREFEQMICDYTGARYCSVVSNGTVSLFIALSAIGVGPGDEVIVPDYTMVATPNAVRLIGATPILVDVDETLCLDIEAVERAITPKTKAVFHVSINGRAGRLQELQTLCVQKGIVLLEDAAQSLGSTYRGNHLGRFGAIGSFSFSVPKIITTGQGGALITDDEALYQRIAKIKDFGRIRGGVDIHDEMGWNFKFTDVLAVIGIEQMKKLSYRVKRKKEIYQRYRANLTSVAAISWIETNTNDVAPWFMDIVVDAPRTLLEYLKTRGVGARVCYPAIHTQKIYASTAAGAFPRASHFGQHGLWLPSASQLTNQDIDYICQQIQDFYR